MRTRIKNYVTILLITISSSAFAQFSESNSSIKILSIQEIKKQAFRLDFKDELLVVKGFVTKKINGDTYIFSDQTGQIRVEIDSKIALQQAFNEKTLVTLTGKLDSNLFGYHELDVKKLVINE